ncbi:MAG TPA: hypothetical protein PLO78_00125 [Candidatus Omnitrophota bacterium]|nr:hypothetical protein [Candidatus Omnitrophota bacterium]
MTVRKTVFLVLSSVLFSMTLRWTIDPDLWWHLKTGQVIVTQGIPRMDIFSFTMYGKPWITHEWLSEVFLWAIHAFGGPPALIIAFALLGVLIFNLVYFTCAGRPFLAFPLTLLACWTSKYMWGPRPQVMNILMVAVFMWLLENIRQKKLSWQWFYLFPFLIMLWVNLHSGYLIGVMVLFTFLAGDALQIFLRKSEEGTFGEKNLWHLTIVSFLSPVVALVNPSGFKIWHYPFETLRSQAMQQGILEWLSPDFHHPFYKPFIAVMVLGAFAFMATHRKRNITEMFLYAGTMAAGLISRRHIPFFAVVAVPIISRALLDCFQDSKWWLFLEEKILSPKPSRIVQIVNTVLVISVLAVTGQRTSQQILSNEIVIRGEFPVEAIKFMKEKGITKLHGYNEYGWGGFLIWNDIPVFIDGRVDMYGGAFFRMWANIYDLQSKNWTEMYSIFKQFDVRYVLLKSNSLLAAVLRTNQDWAEAFRDRTASLFILQKPLP